MERGNRTVPRNMTTMANPEEFTVHSDDRPFMASLLRMCARLCALLIAVSLCPAQEAKIPSDERVYSFGVTVVTSGWLKGDIYLLKEDTSSLPNFKKLKPIGSIYTPILKLPTRNFQDGFPGVTDRFEWFAIDYNGRLWISKPGNYRFALESDDGSKLYIDSKTIIYNDGTHAPATRTGYVYLEEGVHTIQVSYFQGPRYQIALTLAIAEPGEEKYYIFNMEKYKIPADKLTDDILRQAPDAKSEKNPK
jgi:hypothetical protein